MRSLNYFLAATLVTCLLGVLGLNLTVGKSRWAPAPRSDACGGWHHDVQHWVDFVLTDVPASFRVPPDTARAALMPYFQDVWIGSDWILRVDVGQDTASVPIGGAEGPVPPDRTHVAVCVDPRAT